MVQISTCPQCGGAGKITTEPCETCQGRGKLRKMGRIEVTIPKGIDNGQYLRVAGEGEAGERGGPPGDVYVVVHVAPHPIFERHGRDLYCKTTIDFATAILGGEVQVPTMTGNGGPEDPGGHPDPHGLPAQGPGDARPGLGPARGPVCQGGDPHPREDHEEAEGALKEFSGEKKEETAPDSLRN